MGTEVSPSPLSITFPETSLIKIVEDEISLVVFIFNTDMEGFGEMENSSEFEFVLLLLNVLLPLYISS